MVINVVRRAPVAAIHFRVVAEVLPTLVVTREVTPGSRGMVVQTIHRDTTARQIAQSVPVPSKDGTGLPSIKEGIQIRWGANQERAILSADNPPLSSIHPPASCSEGGFSYIRIMTRKPTNDAECVCDKLYP